ncbi:phosphoenolpyruvate phosphomutase-domain-containing protein [Aspergillus pseudodeflectus]|uniref:Phosphoenolpyruvate phosphomutase-domain-containing protein n=1 Tax=Aspergillus pseudodeflectus TaxID=176178 RepID=A0ABR4KQU9_9EURO
MTVHTPQNELAKRLRNLHVPGDPIVFTNVYDAATASFIANHPTTKAIATASFAIAASQGIPDNEMTLAQNIATVRSIASALTVDGLPKLPLSVDVQDGYENVAETIKEIISLGAVGCNIEDFNNRTEQMRTLPEAVSRIGLAIQTARELGVPDFVINARTDILGHGGSVDDAIERGKAFLAAGACTVFVWGPGGRGVRTEEVEKLVAALDGRLNVKLVIKDGYLTIPELKSAGVSRISMGPELYRAAMRAFEETANNLLEMPEFPDFLPVENSTKPFWRTELHELDELRTTPELPQRSDLVIIGAGYSGVSLAYHIFKQLPASDQPHPAITILEARQICSGATGRNGGHLRPDLYGNIPKYIERYGVEAGAEVANFEISHIPALKKVIAEENIDCDLNLTRSMNVYLNEQEGEQARQIYEALVSRGLEYTSDLHYTPQKYAEKISGVKGAKACISYTAGSLWPYKFVLGLLSKIADSPLVNVQTSTPATSVTSEDGVHIVHTPRGSIRASKVVYTTNAYTAGLLPEYSANIVPCRGICCHISVPEGKHAPFLPYSYILRTADGKGVSYLTVRPDGSIIVGGAQYTFFDQREQWYNVVDDSTLIEPTKNYYDDYMQRTFSGWEDTGAYVKEIWTGIMGYTSDSSPHVGEIPGQPGKYISAGYDGHGMPVIFLATKGLADIIVKGLSFEETKLPRTFKTTAERIQKAANGPEGGDIFAE